MKKIFIIFIISLCVTGCSNAKEAKLKAMSDLADACKVGSTMSLSVDIGNLFSSVRTTCTWVKQPSED